MVKIIKRSFPLALLLFSSAWTNECAGGHCGNLHLEIDGRSASITNIFGLTSTSDNMKYLLSSSNHDKIYNSSLYSNLSPWSYGVYESSVNGYGRGFWNADFPLGIGGYTNLMLGNKISLEFQAGTFAKYHTKYIDPSMPFYRDYRPEMAVSLVYKQKNGGEHRITWSQSCIGNGMFP